MNKLIVRVGTGVATAAMFAAMAVPSFAATITNVGGGAFSTSGITVNHLKTVSVSQSNSTNVQTVVNSSNNTGQNSTSFNTGGSNGIGTGPATTTAVVTVTGNSNVAVAAPAMPAMPTTITNIGGGAFSMSGITFNSTNVMSLGQSNMTSVGTVVNGSNNTGNNSAWFNTNGMNGIGTGGASTGVSVSVGGSTNQAAL
jgi:hypothetical protein